MILNVGGSGGRATRRTVEAVDGDTHLGVDSDNDSAFMSQGVFDYCKGRGLEQTRSRAYKKNDEARVEQQNGAVVRRLVGYGRLSGAGATKAQAQLYASSRLYINFFQPSIKLKSKTARRGARAQGFPPRRQHGVRCHIATDSER